MEPRSLVNNLLTILAWVMAVFACVPLFSVLIMLIIRGGARLSWSLFTELPPAALRWAAASATPSSAPWSWWASPRC